MMKFSKLWVLAVTVCSWGAHAGSIHATPGFILAEYTRQAGIGADPARGQRLLAKLEANASPLELETSGPVDHDKLEQWFATRCQAALQRGCTVLEKADVASWLLKGQRTEDQ